MNQDIGHYFRDFLTDGLPEMSVNIIPRDIVYEREKSLREDLLEGIEPREFPEEYLEFIAVQRKLAEVFFDYNILLFHGSVVAVDGEAYLFTAKSGTGKSTHTRLWREVFGPRAVMVNDDKPFLEIRDDHVVVHGSPWNGKHRLGENISLPLKAICILERGEENRISPIGPREALTMLMQQSQRPQDRLKLPLYLDLVDKLSSSVRFYRMACNMDPSAAVIAYETMSNDK